jgi:hypothetical protein
MAPNMTGKVPRDPAWSGATKVSIGPSGASYFVIGHLPDSTGQDYVYVGVFMNDFIPSSSTRAILGFVTLLPDLNAMPPPPVPCAWKIHVWPIPPATPSLANTIQYWRNCPPWGAGGAGGWNQPGGDTDLPPAGPVNGWLQSWTPVWNPPNSQMWSFEMKIPFNPAGDFGDEGIWFPPGPTPFYMYLNVLSTPNGGSGGNIQAPWPSGGTIMGPIETGTPDAQTYWGLACLQ